MSHQGRGHPRRRRPHAPRLAPRPDRPRRAGRRGAVQPAGHRAGVRRPSRRPRRGARRGPRLRAAPVRRAAPHREGRQPQRAPRPGRLLHRLDELSHDRLQGDAQRVPAADLLPGPPRRALRGPARARPQPVLDQHLPVVGPGAPVPLHQPQRRDQHPARERELDVRPPVDVPVRGVRGRPPEGPAGGPGRRLRHPDLRQRAGAAPPVGPEPRPRDDDDGPRAVGPEYRDERRAPRVLRVPLVPHGAVGRAGVARVHGRHPDRRHARPQRAAPRPLLGDPRRPGRHGLRGRRARHPARGRDREGPPPARADVPRGHGAGPDHPGRGAQGRDHRRRAVRGVGAGRARPARGPARPDVRHRPRPRDRPPPPGGVRLHRRGRADDHHADGDDRHGPGRVDGQRRASRRPVGEAAAPVQLLQAAVRPGHQPAGRRDPGRDHHGHGPFDRAGGEPPRAGAGRGAPGRDPVAGDLQLRAGADPRARRRAGIARLQDDHAADPVQGLGQRGGPPARDRGPPAGRVGGDQRGLQPDHPVRPRPQRDRRADPGAARRELGPSPPRAGRDPRPDRPRARIRRAARGPPLLPAHRLRRVGDQPVPRVRDDRRPGAPRRDPRPLRGGRAPLPQGRDQGRHQGHLADGHQHGPQLPRRAGVRGDRPQSRLRRRVLHLDADPDRRHRDRGRVQGGQGPPGPRLAPAPADRAHPAAAGRAIPVPRGRREPPVQPVDDPHPPALRPQRRLRGIQGLQLARRRPELEARDAARPARAEGGATLDPDRGGRAGRDDRPPVQDRAR